MNKKISTRMLCEGAIMVAAAQLLGYLKLYRLPQGGSVTLVMLPIFLFSFRWGWKSGVLAGFTLGLLQLMFDGAYTWGWQSVFGDYLLAYAALGLAGLFGKVRGGYVLGMTAGFLARFACHFYTGAVIWAEYMPEVMYGIKMTGAGVYSLVYNASYLVPSFALCVMVALLVKKPLDRLPAADKG